MEYGHDHAHAGGTMPYNVPAQRMSIDANIDANVPRSFEALSSTAPGAGPTASLIMLRNATEARPDWSTASMSATAAPPSLAYSQASPGFFIPSYPTQLGHFNGISDGVRAYSMEIPQDGLQLQSDRAGPALMPMLPAHSQALLLPYGTTGATPVSNQQQQGPFSQYHFNSPVDEQAP